MFAFGRSNLFQKVCLFILIASFVSCLWLAFNNSRGLTMVQVACLDSKKEPNDAGIPFVLAIEQLPDYSITIYCSDRSKVKLATVVNQSAKDGLSWKLPDPVPLSTITGIRLLEMDKILSDDLVEVEIDQNYQPVTKGNYRFEFQTEVSFAAGIKAFFQTPLGKIVCTLFFVAGLILILKWFV